MRRMNTVKRGGFNNREEARKAEDKGQSKKQKVEWGDISARVGTRQKIMTWGGEAGARVCGGW